MARQQVATTWKLDTDRGSRLEPRRATIRNMTRTSTGRPGTRAAPWPSPYCAAIHIDCGGLVVCGSWRSRRIRTSGRPYRLGNSRQERGDIIDTGNEMEAVD